MRELFPGFYKRTEKELSDCWQEGIFVFDTNMLLNVYRYTQETRERYFEILDIQRKRNQLWIPYQVAYEYQDNRIEVIQGQLDAYTQVTRILETTGQKLENSLEPYRRKHGFINADQLSKDLMDAIKNAKSTIRQDKEKNKKEYESIKKDDRLLEKLERIFQGSIGSPYTNTRLEEMYKRAQLRMELQIPPGWKDEEKNSVKAYGDIILWFQLIDYAQIQKKPIILVTDDGKKDWWIRDSNGNPIKPLPGLIQEMFVEAGVLLHMYQGYEFLEQAEHFLNLEKKPNVVEEAKEVTQHNLEYVLWQKLDQIRGDLGIYGIAEVLVLEWARQTYPSHKIITGRVEALDFILIAPDKSTIGVEVKYKSSSYSAREIEKLFCLIDVRYEGQPLDHLIIVLVSRDIEEAGVLIRRMQQKNISIPSNISLVIGYLDSGKGFCVFSTLP